MLAGKNIMSMSFTVQLNDPNHLSQDAALVADVNAAAADWSRFLNALGTIDIQVNVAAMPQGRASGGPGMVVFAGTDGPRNVFESGSVSEMRSGVDPNGASPDVIITVDPSYLQNELWLDPDPGHRSAIPSNRTDGISVLLHEIGHGFGINGYRDPNTGALPADHESPWDRLVQLHSDGSAWFVGPSARTVYGGDVPVTTLSNGEQYFHLGNGGDAASQDLMNGVAFSHATSYNISALDLAILRDLGAPVSAPRTVQWAGSPDLGVRSPPYQVAGVGDFDEDGTSDIL